MVNRQEVERKLAIALVDRGYSGVTVVPETEGEVSGRLLMAYSRDGQIVAVKGLAGELRDHILALPRFGRRATIGRTTRMRGMDE